MPSDLIWWGAPEIKPGNEDATIELIESKIEAKEKELLEAMNNIYNKLIMGQGTITCSYDFFDVINRVELKIRAMKKARKRRMRNAYLQRRARA